jgi:hypothetical protein
MNIAEICLLVFGIVLLWALLLYGKHEEKGRRRILQMYGLDNQPRILCNEENCTMHFSNRGQYKVHMKRDHNIQL